MDTELRNKLMLGKVAEEIATEQISQARSHHEKLKEAAIQLDAAQICIQNSLDIIDTIPNSNGWLVSIFLRMISIQLINHAKQLVSHGAKEVNDATKKDNKNKR